MAFMQLLRRRTAAWAVMSSLGAAGLAAAMLVLDGIVDLGAGIPADNARVLLGSAFGGLVTIGAFTFWMRPLAAQMASTSVPPRVLSGHLHDDFQRLVVSATVGALTYVAVVIYNLPSGTATSPTLATAIAGLVAVAAIVALFTGMEHAERTMRPGRVLAATARSVADDLRALPAAHAPALEHVDVPERPGLCVVARRSGWVQDFDETALAMAVPEHAVVRLEAPLGAFVVAGWSSLVTVWVPDHTPEPSPHEIAAHLVVGEERGDRLDLPGKLAQLVDVGVHAASGGSGSPSMAYEALWHLGAVLHEIVRCELPPAATEHEGGRVVVGAHTLEHGELVEATVERIRRVMADEPQTATELARVLRDVRAEAVEVGRETAVAAIDRQLDLCVAQCRHAGAFEADLRRVEEARHGVAPRSSMPNEGYGSAEAP